MVRGIWIPFTALLVSLIDILVITLALQQWTCSWSRVVYEFESRYYLKIPQWYNENVLKRIPHISNCMWILFTVEHNLYSVVHIMVSFVSAVWWYVCINIAVYTAIANKLFHSFYSVVLIVTWTLLWNVSKHTLKHF